MSGIQASASGVRDASVRLNVAANNIANSVTKGFVPDRVESSAAPNRNGVETTVRSSAEPFEEASVRAELEAADQSGTDMAAELVQTKLAETAYKANATMLQVQAKVDGYLIKLV